MCGYMCFNKIYMYDIVELTVLIYLKHNTSRRADSNRPFATMMLLYTCMRIIQTALTKASLLMEVRRDRLLKGTSY